MWRTHSRKQQSLRKSGDCLLCPKERRLRCVDERAVPHFLPLPLSLVRFHSYRCPIAGPKNTRACRVRTRLDACPRCDMISPAMNQALLLSCFAIAAIAADTEPKVKLPSSRADLARGEKLFKVHCSRCHGPKGRRQPWTDADSREADPRSRRLRAHRSHRRWDSRHRNARLRRGDVASRGDANCRLRPLPW